MIYRAISPRYAVGCALFMGLRRLTYGDLWGCCGCGLRPMGLTYGLLLTYGIAAVDLWGSMVLLWLRSGTYGVDLWVSIIVVSAVSDLWG